MLQLPPVYSMCEVYSTMVLYTIIWNAQQHTIIKVTFVQTLDMFVLCTLPKNNTYLHKRHAAAQQLKAALPA